MNKKFFIFAILFVFLASSFILAAECSDDSCPLPTSENLALSGPEFDKLTPQQQLNRWNNNPDKVTLLDLTIAWGSGGHENVKIFLEKNPDYLFETNVRAQGPLLDRLIASGDSKSVGIVDKFFNHEDKYTNAETIFSHKNNFAKYLTKKAALTGSKTTFDLSKISRGKVKSWGGKKLEFNEPAVVKGKKKRRRIPALNLEQVSGTKAVSVSDDGLDFEEEDGNHVVISGAEEVERIVPSDPDEGEGVQYHIKVKAKECPAKELCIPFHQHSFKTDPKKPSSLKLSVDDNGDVEAEGKGKVIGTFQNGRHYSADIEAGKFIVKENGDASADNARVVFSGFPENEDISSHVVVGSFEKKEGQYLLKPFTSSLGIPGITTFTEINSQGASTFTSLDNDVVIHPLSDAPDSPYSKGQAANPFEIKKGMGEAWVNHDGISQRVSLRGPVGYYRSLVDSLGNPLGVDVMSPQFEGKNDNAKFDLEKKGAGYKSMTRFSIQGQGVYRDPDKIISTDQDGSRVTQDFSIRPGTDYLNVRCIDCSEGSSAANVELTTFSTVKGTYGTLDSQGRVRELIHGDTINNPPVKINFAIGKEGDVRPVIDKKSIKELGELSNLESIRQTKNLLFNVRGSSIGLVDGQIIFEKGEARSVIDLKLAKSFGKPLIIQDTKQSAQVVDFVSRFSSGDLAKNSQAFAVLAARNGWDDPQVAKAIKQTTGFNIEAASSDNQYLSSMQTAMVQAKDHSKALDTLRKAGFVFDDAGRCVIPINCAQIRTDLFYGKGDSTYGVLSVSNSEIQEAFSNLGAGQFIQKKYQSEGEKALAEFEKRDPDVFSREFDPTKQIRLGSDALQGLDPQDRNEYLDLLPKDEGDSIRKRIAFAEGTYTDSEAASLSRARNLAAVIGRTSDSIVRMEKELRTVERALNNKRQELVNRFIRRDGLSRKDAEAKAELEMRNERAFRSLSPLDWKSKAVNANKLNQAAQLRKLLDAHRSTLAGYKDEAAALITHSSPLLKPEVQISLGARAEGTPLTDDFQQEMLKQGLVGLDENKKALDKLGVATVESNHKNNARKALALTELGRYSEARELIANLPPGTAYSNYVKDMYDDEVLGHRQMREDLMDAEITRGKALRELSDYVPEGLGSQIFWDSLRGLGHTFEYIDPLFHWERGYDETHEQRFKKLSLDSFARAEGARKTLEAIRKGENPESNAYTRSASYQEISLSAKANSLELQRTQTKGQINDIREKLLKLGITEKEVNNDAQLLDLASSLQNIENNLAATYQGLSSVAQQARFEELQERALQVGADGVYLEMSQLADSGSADAKKFIDEKAAFVAFRKPITVASFGLDFLEGGIVLVKGISAINKIRRAGAYTNDVLEAYRLADRAVDAAERARHIKRAEELTEKAGIFEGVKKWASKRILNPAIKANQKIEGVFDTLLPEVVQRSRKADIHLTESGQRLALLRKAENDQAQLDQISDVARLSDDELSGIGLSREKVDFDLETARVNSENSWQDFDTLNNALLDAGDVESAIRDSRRISQSKLDELGTTREALTNDLISARQQLRVLYEPVASSRVRDPPQLSLVRDDVATTGAGGRPLADDIHPSSVDESLQSQYGFDQPAANTDVEVVDNEFCPIAAAIAVVGFAGKSPCAPLHDVSGIKDTSPDVGPPQSASLSGVSADNALAVGHSMPSMDAIPGEIPSVVLQSGPSSSPTSLAFLENEVVREEVTRNIIAISKANNEEGIAFRYYSHQLIAGEGAIPKYAHAVDETGLARILDSGEPAIGSRTKSRLDDSDIQIMLSSNVEKKGISVKLGSDGAIVQGLSTIDAEDIVHIVVRNDKVAEVRQLIQKSGKDITIIPLSEALREQEIIRLARLNSADRSNLLLEGGFRISVPPSQKDIVARGLAAGLSKDKVIGRIYGSLQHNEIIYSNGIYYRVVVDNYGEKSIFELSHLGQAEKEFYTMGVPMGDTWATSAENIFTGDARRLGVLDLSSSHIKQGGIPSHIADGKLTPPSEIDFGPVIIKAPTSVFQKVDTPVPASIPKKPFGGHSYEPVSNLWTYSASGTVSPEVITQAGDKAFGNRWIVRDENGKLFYVSDKAPKEQSLAGRLGEFITGKMNKKVNSQLRYPEMRVADFGNGPVVLSELAEGSESLRFISDDGVTIDANLLKLVDKETGIAATLQNIWFRNWDFKAEHILVDPKTKKVTLIDFEKGFGADLEPFSSLGSTHPGGVDGAVLDRIASRSNPFLLYSIDDYEEAIKVFESLTEADYERIRQMILDSGYSSNDAQRILFELQSDAQDIREELQYVLNKALQKKQTPVKPNPKTSVADVVDLPKVTPEPVATTPSPAAPTTTASDVASDVVQPLPIPTIEPSVPAVVTTPELPVAPKSIEELVTTSPTGIPNFAKYSDDVVTSLEEGRSVQTAAVEMTSFDGLESIMGAEDSALALSEITKSMSNKLEQLGVKVYHKGRGSLKFVCTDCSDDLANIVLGVIDEVKYDAAAVVRNINPNIPILGTDVHFSIGISDKSKLGFLPLFRRNRAKTLAANLNEQAIDVGRYANDFVCGKTPCTNIDSYSKPSWRTAFIEVDKEKNPLLYYHGEDIAGESDRVQNVKKLVSSEPNKGQTAIQHEYGVLDLALRDKRGAIKGDNNFDIAIQHHLETGADGGNVFLLDDGNIGVMLSDFSKTPPEVAVMKIDIGFLDEVRLQLGNKAAAEVKDKALEVIGNLINKYNSKSKTKLDFYGGRVDTPESFAHAAMQLFDKEMKNTRVLFSATESRSGKIPPVLSVGITRSNVEIDNLVKEGKDIASLLRSRAALSAETVSSEKIFTVFGHFEEGAYRGGVQSNYLIRSSNVFPQDLKNAKPRKSLSANDRKIAEFIGRNGDSSKSRGIVLKDVGLHANLNPDGSIVLSNFQGLGFQIRNGKIHELVFSKKEVQGLAKELLLKRVGKEISPVDVELSKKLGVQVTMDSSGRLHLSESLNPAKFRVNYGKIQYLDSSSGKFETLSGPAQKMVLERIGVDFSNVDVPLSQELGVQVTLDAEGIVIHGPLAKSQFQIADGVLKRGEFTLSDEAINILQERKIYDPAEYNLELSKELGAVVKIDSGTGEVYIAGGVDQNKYKIIGSKIFRGDKELSPSAAFLISKYLPEDLPNVLSQKIDPRLHPEHVSKVSPTEAASGLQTGQYNMESILREWDNLGPLSTESIGTHPLTQHINYDTGEVVLIKGGPAHTTQADFIGQRMFALNGLPVPKTTLATRDGELIQLIQFLPDSTTSTKMPYRFHEDETLQSGFLVDALIGNYDRASWNVMYGDRGITFIDQGASIGSRAQGGFNGFPNHVDLDQLRDILTNPQFGGKINPAYANLLEVTAEGRVIVKNRKVMRQSVSKLRKVSDSQIDAIVDEAYKTMTKAEMRDRVLDRMKALEGDPNPRSKSAFETAQKIINDFNGDEAAYYKHALKKRRDDLIDIFGTPQRSRAVKKSDGVYSLDGVTYVKVKDYNTQVSRYSVTDASGEARTLTKENDLETIVQLEAARMDLPLDLVESSMTRKVSSLSAADGTISPSKIHEQTLELASMIDSNTVLTKEKIKELALLRARTEVEAGHMTEDQFQLLVNNFDDAFFDTSLQVAGGQDLMDFLDILRKREPGFTHVHLLRDAEVIGLSDAYYQALTGVASPDVKLIYTSRKSTTSGGYPQSDIVGQMMHAARAESSSLTEFRVNVQKRFDSLMASSEIFRKKAEEAFQYLVSQGLIYDGAKLRFIDSCCTGSINFFLESTIRYHEPDLNIEFDTILMASGIATPDGGSLGAGLSGNSIEGLSKTLTFSGKFDPVTNEPLFVERLSGSRLRDAEMGGNIARVNLYGPRADHVGAYIDQLVAIRETRDSAGRSPLYTPKRPPPPPAPTTKVTTSEVVPPCPIVGHAAGDCLGRQLSDGKIAWGIERTDGRVDEHLFDGQRWVHYGGEKGGVSPFGGDQVESIDDLVTLDTARTGYPLSKEPKNAKESFYQGLQTTPESPPVREAYVRGEIGMEVPDPFPDLDLPSGLQARTTEPHVTLLTPQETRVLVDARIKKIVAEQGLSKSKAKKLARKQIAEEITTSVAGKPGPEYLGVGRISQVEEGVDNEVFYVLANWDAGRDLRQGLGLPPTEFHTTVAFKESDIFTKPKDISSRLDLGKISDQTKDAVRKLHAENPELARKQIRKEVLEELGLESQRVPIVRIDQNDVYVPTMNGVAIVPADKVSEAQAKIRKGSDLESLVADGISRPLESTDVVRIVDSYPGDTSLEDILKHGSGEAWTPSKERIEDTLETARIARLEIAKGIGIDEKFVVSMGSTARGTFNKGDVDLDFNLFINDLPDDVIKDSQKFNEIKSDFERLSEITGSSNAAKIERRAILTDISRKLSTDQLLVTVPSTTTTQLYLDITSPAGSRFIGELTVYDDATAATGLLNHMTTRLSPLEIDAARKLKWWLKNNDAYGGVFKPRGYKGVIVEQLVIQSRLYDAQGLVLREGSFETSLERLIQMADNNERIVHVGGGGSLSVAEDLSKNTADLARRTLSKDRDVAAVYDIAEFELFARDTLLTGQSAGRDAAFVDSHGVKLIEMPLPEEASRNLDELKRNIRDILNNEFVRKNKLLVGMEVPEIVVRGSGSDLHIGFVYNNNIEKFPDTYLIKGPDRNKIPENKYAAALEKWKDKHGVEDADFEFEDGIPYFYEDSPPEIEGMPIEDLIREILERRLGSST